jgi:hypothetical protein
LKSEGEVTSLSGADKREVRDNREKWWEYREKSKYFSNCTTFHIRGALSWHLYRTYICRSKKVSKFIKKNKGGYVFHPSLYEK